MINDPERTTLIGDPFPESPSSSGDAPRRKERRVLRARNILWFVVLVIVVAAFALSGDKGASENLNAILVAPGHGGHIFGTDELGRDVLLQVVAGLPWSVEVSLIATGAACLLGLTFGVMAAWYQGVVSRAALRIIDFYVAFPFIVFAIVLVNVVGRGVLQLGLILGLGIWPLVARVIYGETRRIKEEEFVVYSRIVWQADHIVILKHVIPTLGKRSAVVSAFIFGDVLGASAALALLGIGPPLSTPNWGAMLSDGQQYLGTAPWIAGGAALALVALVLTVNLLADRLQ